MVADLQRMLDANHLPKSSREAPRIDESLHDYFIAKAGNSYIRELLRTTGGYYRLLFEWEDHEPEVA